MKVLCIDPGAHQVGFAVLEQSEGRSEVVQAGLFAFETKQELAVWGQSHGADLVVIERPQVYPQARQKGDPNDLIAVALSAGAAATVSSRVRFVRPREWKGTREKTLNLNLILKDLSGRPEAARVQAQLAGLLSSVRHNAIDAVGLALWWEQRTSGS